MSHLALAFSFLVLIPFASADMKDEIARLADAIRTEARSSRASSEELRTVKELLETSLRTLKGGGGSSHDSRYSCGSRDNDDRAPFILISRDSDWNSTRHETVRFRTVESCRATIEAIQKDVSSAYVCYSRDGDDANPWLLGALGSDRSVKEIGKFRAQSSCLQSLRDSWVESTRSGITFCSSRDGDDANPWTLVKVRSGASSVVQQYSSYESCAQELGR